MTSPAKSKDLWDKLDILFKPLGGLFTALAVALLGFMGSNYLEKRQAEEGRIQLYTELMSQREAAESALRKDMFTTIIQSFLKSESASLDEQVLNLELLAYNFHESLNLKPLFAYLNRKLDRVDGYQRAPLQARLEKVAREISRRQLMVLEGAGAGVDRTVDMAALAESPGGIKLDSAMLTVAGVERSYDLYVQQVDMKSRELRLRLEVFTPSETESAHKSASAEFWIGFYDFPMIDNTRLPHDQRVAVVLNQLDEVSAELTLVYFPGAFASLKEKPYFQEVLNQLMPATAP